ncbi:hypothetical protein AZF37_03735 [endosymbiont 'TC1' of Trimyema compressum]|uniref:transcription termination factor NusA n=1 Tax=endosymbiont 'TC1' of Trimyema compressum TaxID=243899 RepID=UPI0007F09F59|nr:transcription termination factor NusA [endosymbiont 'TC1' of Trimyema compressum]AMP20397.1 hypothetical protein AZF37_03735 [endosymbiont 'TC1' of Trimyema compressum]
MDNKELILAVKALEVEKVIDPEVLYTTIEAAIVSGIKKKQISDYKNEVKDTVEVAKPQYENLKAILDRETGKIDIYLLRTVVEEVTDELNEISVKEAKEKYHVFEIGSLVREPIKVDTKTMGRMVAQTAKQIITQKIREIERNNLYEEFAKKEKDIVTCVVTRKSLVEKGHLKDKKGHAILDSEGHPIVKEVYNVFLAINNGEFILPPDEQIENEIYTIGQRLKVYVINVKKTTKAPIVTISRRHKELIKRLFELEVPEIYDGTVVIKDIAREAGSRSKISVYSSNEEVDPIGACIGPKGARIGNVLQEIGQDTEPGEKIDIIVYSENPAIYIENALAPAKILDIRLNEDAKEAKVLVAKDVFSLAIGKDGQNVRLAARLTGWKIDIVSDEMVSSLDDVSMGSPEKEILEERAEAVVETIKDEDTGGGTDSED